jgi:hypothetical protein
MRFPAAGLALLLALGFAADAHAVRRRAVQHPATIALLPQTSVFTPSKDNTLYESSGGSESNGAGIHFFSGSTAGNDKRRAVFAFDLASRIPPGSVVTSVTLRLHVAQTISGAIPFSLHPLLSDWGEGLSNAGPFRDGGGTDAATGDATWIHTFFSDRRWLTPGGDFHPVADATAPASSGFVTWPSSPELVARVQAWVDQPATNFGWILVGGEDRSRSAKAFHSREAVDEEERPTLVIEWMGRIP